MTYLPIQSSLSPTQDSSCTPMPTSSPTDKPSPPRDGQCCESGSCTPCVWDHYYEKLKVWRLEQVRIKEHTAKQLEDNDHNEY